MTYQVSSASLFLNKQYYLCFSIKINMILKFDVQIASCILF